MKRLPGYTIFPVILFCCLCLNTVAQPSFSGWEHLFTTPGHYTACFTTGDITIDGKFTEAAWDQAPWSSLFADIEGNSRPVPRYSTRVRMLWNETYLFVAAELEEPHIWGTLEKHDEVVFFDNDFEVFIDPDNNTHQYFEIEVNALNTVFDLFLPKPYRNNSGALISWDTPGLKSAVGIQGTINNPSDQDKGWIVEMAIPFAALTIGNDPHIPVEGEFFRINFSRVEWDMEISNGRYVKKKDASGKDLPEQNWVWSPQGIINMHYPERWGYVLFTRQENPAQAPVFSMPYSELQRRYLWLVYYKQKEYFERKGHYASGLSDLGITPAEFPVDGKTNVLRMEATSRQFTVTISSQGHTQKINDEGLIH